MNTGQHIAVRVPFATTRHGSGKRIIGPDGATGYNSPRIDSTLVKAIARAHRWNRMLESGEVTTIKDIARAEKINPSYISRVLRLTLLAPDIIEAILDGHDEPQNDQRIKGDGRVERRVGIKPERGGRPRLVGSRPHDEAPQGVDEGRLAHPSMDTSPPGRASGKNRRSCWRYRLL